MSSWTEMGTKADLIIVDDLWPQSWVDAGVQAAQATKFIRDNEAVRTMKGMGPFGVGPLEEFIRGAMPFSTSYKKEKHMDCPRCGAPIRKAKTTVIEEWWGEMGAGEDGHHPDTVVRKRTVTFTCGTVVRTDVPVDRIKTIGEGCE